MVIDEAGDPDHPDDADAAATTAEAKAKAVAPEAVPQEINARYAEKTDPSHWASRFEREGREVFDHRGPILDALKLQPGQQVADVGAGTGLFTFELARRVGPEGTVHAVDVQAYFLDHIGQKAREQKIDNVELVRAKQDAVGLPKDSVDLVLMCDSYHHVEQPAAYLESLRTAIRSGGRLVIVDYRAIEGQSKAWLLDHVRATPDEFRAEIEGAGFRFLREHTGILEENFFYEFERP